ncbi:hypothetical protein GYMLUDRAFT_57032 [Collybiopsis luxurians FD-317 M1]|uniref:O-methyltransferase C-terminal domain-containing protein n=1 Tax=Collybiopsis luxurians FD-317 M1 TaxID=944289 RepID=A0A0D0CW63_9AGAR|nr:hypothetical protein GYMLUDRAFT_57032 [Collybiopsis luxurians FD-317 M1]
MTFAVLRALHAIIGDALDDIERVYAESGNSAQDSRTSTPATPSTSPTVVSEPAQGHAYASPPPSPLILSYSQSSVSSQDRSTTPTLLDFPSLDLPFDANSPSETLTSHHPVVITAINRIVAAAGQMSATVQIPFLTLCDAGMGFHLPSCLRLLEATHTVEILREAGPNGLHVKLISEKNGVEKNKLAHILRLLATHHILREVSPDVFANNRISSILDTGKPSEELIRRQVYLSLCPFLLPQLLPNSPETKYNDTNGIAAFVGITDELFKSSGYLTEAYFLSPQRHKNGREPTRAPFNYAFGCEGVGFFGWLEGEGIDGKHVNGPSRNEGFIPGVVTPVAGTMAHKRGTSSIGKKADMYSTGKHIDKPQTPDPLANPNRFRLERFGKAMTGTGCWEAPGAVLNASLGFDWPSLPKGSIVVDVGGGIGSTSMFLAHAFSSSGSPDDDGPGLKFIIQDREVVVDMGKKAWKAKCPELLESNIAEFQGTYKFIRSQQKRLTSALFTVHDFFTPQPVKNAAVYLLRVICHDWPDSFAQRILLRLREAAAPDTKLLIADFVLPLACADNFGDVQDEDDAGLAGIQGAETELAPAPLLPNLGKASANGYWMDMTMQCMFNGQERTLREIVSLAHSAGWKVTKVTKAPGSLFGHIVAVPAEIPIQRRARSGSGSAFFDVPNSNYMGGSSLDPNEEALNVREIGRASSRCGTPTFGSRMDLPSYEEARARFGGGRAAMRRSGANSTVRPSLKPSTLPVAGQVKKKRPSPLSIIPQSPSPVPRNTSSPRPPPAQVPQSPLKPRTSHAQLHQIYSSQQLSPLPTPSTPRPSLSSPRPSGLSLSRRSSLANLSNHATIPKEPPPLPTSLISACSSRISNRSSPVPPNQTLFPASPIFTRSNLNSPGLSRSPPPPPNLSRRQSHATLSPSAIPRKRSENNSGSPSSTLPPALGGRGNTLMRTLELSGSFTGFGNSNKNEIGSSARPGPLDFGEPLSSSRTYAGGRDPYDIDSEGSLGSFGKEVPPLSSTRSVLAAAARIESLKSGGPNRKPSINSLNRQYSG